MTYTTTTTAAPVWATTWATMPELPTNAPAIIESKRESRPARVWATICARLATLWAILSDYAAGTWLYTIKPAAAKFGRKAAHIITRAALYAFRVVWFAAILVATFETLYALIVTIGDLLPNIIIIRILFFFIFAAAAVGVELLLIAGTRRIDNATENRLFNMH